MPQTLPALPAIYYDGLVRGDFAFGQQSEPAAQRRPNRTQSRPIQPWATAFRIATILRKRGAFRASATRTAPDRVAVEIDQLDLAHVARERAHLVRVLESLASQLRRIDPPPLVCLVGPTIPPPRPRALRFRAGRTRESRDRAPVDGQSWALIPRQGQALPPAPGAPPRAHQLSIKSATGSLKQMFRSSGGRMPRGLAESR